MEVESLAWAPLGESLLCLMRRTYTILSIEREKQLIICPYVTKYLNYTIQGNLSRENLDIKVLFY
jgi:hypothetical protein